jgi:hypothetical protein
MAIARPVVVAQLRSLLESVRPLRQSARFEMRCAVSTKDYGAAAYWKGYGESLLAFEHAVRDRLRALLEEDRSRGRRARK